MVYEEFAEGCVRGRMGYEGTADHEESHALDYTVTIAFIFKMTPYSVHGIDSAVPTIIPTK